MRAFIGIPVPPAPALKKTLDALSRVQGLKTVEPENLHVNLKFLGDVNKEQVEQTKQAMQTLAGTGAFSAKTTNISFFPHVIYATIDSQTHITRLREILDAALENLGFPRDEKFVEHVTLARIKHETPTTRREARKTVENALPIAEFKADKAFLYESILTQKGPVYKPIHEVNFK